MSKHNFDLSADDFVRSAEDRASQNKAKPAATEDLVMLNARVPKGLRYRVKVAAIKHDRSNGSILIEALEQWLERTEASKPELGSTAFDDDGI